MSAGNGQGGSGVGVAVTAARPVVLVRYRPGVVGKTPLTVHVVVLPTPGQTGTVSALCGARLMLTDVEIATPGEGVPCTVCILATATGQPPPGGPEHAGIMGRCYRQWAWPVSLHRDQVLLSLYREVSALAIPQRLGIDVTHLLITQGCTPAVLVHPYAPEHQIVLIGERYGVHLPWPGQAHRVIGFLPLPPTVTARGPITWTQPPDPGSLRLCREIDLFTALRAIARDL